MGSSSTKDMLDKGHNFALSGLVIALIAFSFSIMPLIWDTSQPVLEEQLVESEVIEDKVIDGENTEELKTTYLKLMVILLAAGAIMNGIFGFFRSDQRYMGSAAIFIGVGAIIVQYLWISIIIIVAIVIIAAVLASLGVEF